MKFIFALFTVFFLLLVVDISYGRKDLGDYWKNMMNGQAMPEVIKDLIQVPQVSDAGKEHFIRGFDTKINNATQFHTHAVSKKQKHKAFDQKFEPVSRNNRKSRLYKPSKRVELEALKYNN